MLGIAHSQPLEAIYLYIVQMMDSFFNLFCALRDSKQRKLTRIVSDRNNHPIEEASTPFDNVKMTEGNGVKTTGIDGDHA